MLRAADMWRWLLLGQEGPALPTFGALVDQIVRRRWQSLQMELYWSLNLPNLGHLRATLALALVV